MWEWLNPATVGGREVFMAVPWAVIIPAAISALGMFMGNRGGNQSADSMMTPEMRQMLQMQMQRMRGQEPLYRDVMGMARALLPTRYRTGRPARQPYSGGPPPGGAGPGWWDGGSSDGMDTYGSGKKPEY